MKMNYKIVADSSSDVLSLDTIPFANVPLVIHAGEKTFVDDENCDVEAMTAYMLSYKGKSSTACPGTQDWLDTFGDAENVFCVTITSGLSGSYNSARLAGEEYVAAHPGRRVHVVDTLSAGPELRLVVEKLQELILEGLPFDEIVEKIEKYHRQSFLVFSLQSLHNFVANGRVSPAVGALVGLLGIRVVGKASEQGTLEPLSKARGDRKALQELIRIMKELGWKGGRVRIAHNSNEAMANALRDALCALHGKLDVAIEHCRGLCCYYAEKGGLLVGFEGA
ncbi:MAG: DegV family protein [Clostridia bacterium]|nr:DegV family protein [Clostridia bacterium]